MVYVCTVLYSTVVYNILEGHFNFHYENHKGVFSVEFPYVQYLCILGDILYLYMVCIQLSTVQWIQKYPLEGYSTRRFMPNQQLKGAQS
jgi:hypothetical protein